MPRKNLRKIQVRQKLAVRKKVRKKNAGGKKRTFAFDGDPALERGRPSEHVQTEAEHGGREALGTQVALEG